MLKKLSDNDWNILANTNIFFGHQSLGLNIIDGIQELMKGRSGIKLNIVETINPNTFVSGIFAHSKVGQNEKPISKIWRFNKLLRSGIGKRADIAFYKFSYTDINLIPDVNKLFNNYQESCQDLRRRYPKIRFVHITMPLTTIQRGPKAWLKKIACDSNDEFNNNIRRNKFNHLLRDQYEGSEPFFDLARIESKSSNGDLATFFKDGNQYFHLNHNYTNNGSNLNKTGQKWVAKKLLLFLANLSTCC